MSDFKLEVNYKAVGQLLKSQDMADAIRPLADDIAKRAGEGYASDTHVAKSRVVCAAYTKTKEAKKDNLKNNTLLSALQ